MDEKIFERNIQSLKGRHNNILEQFNSLNSDSHINIIDAKDGNKSMSVEIAGQNLTVHSKYKPLEEAKRWVETLEIKNNSVIILFGFGLGYQVREIMKSLSERTRLFIIEPRANILYETIKNVDCSDIFEHQNVFITVGETEEQMRTFLWSYVSWEDLTNITFRSLPNYDKLYIQEYKNFLVVFKDLQNSRNLDRNTVFYFAEQWQENLLKNLSHIFNSHYVKDFFNVFKDKPVIVVSAGPSLSKNMHLLREIKELAVIICVGTALRPLLKENIIPDFVMSIDGHVLNYKHFEGLEYSNIPLVYTPIIYPDILKDHKGEKVLFLTEDRHLKKLFKKHDIEIGGLKTGNSVANSAFDLAVMMGADPVIFVGQDLAFTDKKTHSSGTVYENNRIEEEKEYIVVEDIYGNDILTDKSLYSFLIWFENQIANDKSGRTYIDATEGGAKIKGTKVMTLLEVKEQYCQENIKVSEVINNILKRKKGLNKELLFQIISDYKENYEEFKIIREKCRKADKLSEELYTIYETNRFNNIKKINTKLKKLDEIDGEIKGKMDKFDLLEHIIQPIIYSVVNTMQEKESETETEKGMRIALKSRLLYKGLEETIKYILPILDNSIKEIELLIEPK